MDPPRCAVASVSGGQRRSAAKQRTEVLEPVEHPPDVAAGAVPPQGMQLDEVRIGKKRIKRLTVSPLHEHERLPRRGVPDLRRMIGVQAERNHRATVAGHRLRRAARVRAVVLVVGEVEQVQRVQTHNPPVAGYAT